MASDLSKVIIIVNAFGYVKARERCARLFSFRSVDADDDSRVTGDQWREMTQELLIIEEILADTKALFQEFYRAVTASTMDFYE